MKLNIQWQYGTCKNKATDNFYAGSYIIINDHPNAMHAAYEII